MPIIALANALALGIVNRSLYGRPTGYALKIIHGLSNNINRGFNCGRLFYNMHLI
jgi:hypothetical protein